MNLLHTFLVGHVNECAAIDGKDLSPEQVEEIVKGLEYYITDYLAEQVPEQMEIQEQTNEREFQL